MYQRISVDSAAALMAEKRMDVLDIRDFSSYSAAHIVGARHLAESAIPRFIRSTSREQPLLIYCYHGHASREIAQLFTDFGFTEVYSMDQGFAGWQIKKRNIIINQYQGLA